MPPAHSRPWAPSRCSSNAGAHGCLARIDGGTLEQPAPAVSVVDTVGAGDAFVAGYLAELMTGAEPVARVRTAVAAGAFAVTVSGDWEGMPDRRALTLLDATEPGHPLTAGAVPTVGWSAERGRTAQSRVEAPAQAPPPVTSYGDQVTGLVM